MALRSAGRKLSFDILTTADAETDDVLLPRSISDPPAIGGAAHNDRNPKKKRKKRKSKKSTAENFFSNIISEEDTVTGRDGEVIDHSSFADEFTAQNYGYNVVETYQETAVVMEVPEGRGRDCTVCTAIPSPQLRQRNVNFVVNGGIEIEAATSSVTSLGSEESRDVDSNENESNSLKGESERVNEAELQMHQQQQQQRTVDMNGRKLETEMSLDWKKLMAEDPNHAYAVEKSSMKYFLEEICAGNSLRSTVALGNEKERERVYDTIFRLPWRCELLINVGFFCLLGFLPVTFNHHASKDCDDVLETSENKFKKPSAAELSDFGCLVVLVSGVTLLQQADISLIYHMIRGQGTIKLYVVYNVLEIFDKLCQSFGGDVMQTLFNTADGLANGSPDSLRYWLWRLVSDETLAVASSIVHSFVLLAQGITLSTCIVAHNNALFALLVSNNFAEIKSNVFKRFSKDNIHRLVYFDSVERFHISAFLLFVLAQNILEAEGPWFENFLFNALVVYICEMMIDIIKHSFIAKFNDIKPIAFSEFLEELCKQTLKIQADNGKRTLTFVPLAPACVVIRVLRPVYAAHLPLSPLPWRLFWIFLLSAMTFVMLSSLKLLIGMGLRKHARWYIKRCEKRKLHTD